jgi:hypothetical protein
VITVEVVGKRECGLCDDVKAALLEARRGIPFDLREVDIESTPALHAVYKDRIPLVRINGRLAFKGRVDPVALRRRLAREALADRLRWLLGHPQGGP